MKRYKCYVILARHKTEKEEFVGYGYVEHSFSVGWDENYVRVWRIDLKDDNFYKNPDAQMRYYLEGARATLNRDMLNPKEWELFFARVGSKKCPVKIDWKRFYKLSKSGRIKKWDWRNLLFKPKLEWQQG